jgi:hypothetical protein
MSRDIRAYTCDVILTARIRRAVARAAVLAAATTCCAVALASPAAAEKLDKHLAVDCPQPYSQTCSPRQGLSVTTSTREILATFTADGNPPSCAPGVVTIYIDGRPFHGTPMRLDPGQSTSSSWAVVDPGNHQIEVQMAGVLGGCNTGSMSGWSGNLDIRTDNDAREAWEPVPGSHVPLGPSPSPSASQPPANSCDPRVDICVH